MAIYVMWGGTFLAICVATLRFPRFLTAGSHFFVAGVDIIIFRPNRHQREVFDA